MARALQEQSHSGATAVGGGDHMETGGRVSVSLFVVTDADPTTLDVQLEASMDGENWAPIRMQGSDQVTLSASEFADSGTGDYSAFAAAHGVAARYVRASITDYGSAGNVDTWVAASSNDDTAKDYREVS